MQGLVQNILAHPGRYSVADLQRGLESGYLPAYVAIPLIQQKSQEQKQFQLGQMAEQGAGQPPVVQQVMQEAAGISALPSNLPAEGFAEGGVVGFSGGGRTLLSPDGPLRDLFDATGRAWSHDFDDETERIRKKRAEAVPYAPVAEDNDPAREPQKGVQYPAPPKQRRAPPPEQHKKDPAPAPAPAPMASPAQAQPDAVSAARKQYEDSVGGIAALTLPKQDYSKREARLAKQEADLEGRKSDNVSMALMQAGLAMMSSGNIGKGGLAGLESYARGKKNISDLEKEIATGRDKIEDLMATGDERAATYELQKLKPKMDLYKSIYETAAKDRTEDKKTAAQERMVDKKVAGQIKAAGIGASGRGSREMQEYGDLQVKVMEQLAKNPKYQFAPPEVQRQMYENALRTAVASNPFLRGHAAPASGSAGWGIKEIK